MLNRFPTLSGAYLLISFLVVGCANSPPMMGTGSGGAVGSSGGAPGSGGGSASGGNTGGLILGSGGPFAFPHNKKPGNCLLTTVANASSAAQAAYNSWKQAFVTSSGAGNGLRVQRSASDGYDTVSEGIGYGMIAAAYMGDRTTFDGLWTYAQAHLDERGLMNWHLNASGGIVGAGSATDGDVDIVWGLIMGSNQWSSQAYLTAARTMINNLSMWVIAPDGMLKPGDGWSGTPLTNPSYFAPSYFRVFAAVTGDANWKGVILDRNYAILAKVAGDKGLVPDWTNNSGDVNKGNLATQMMPGNYDNSSYGYDATRTPWRIALDYCFNDEPRAKAYLDKIGAFFNGIGAANIGDKYSLSGQQQSGNKNMAFIGPAGVSGMAGFQSLVDGAFTYGNTNNGGDGAYFPQSLRVLTMLMMSGNFVDFTKPQ